MDMHKIDSVALRVILGCLAMMLCFLDNFLPMALDNHLDLVTNCHIVCFPQVDFLIGNPLAPVDTVLIHRGQLCNEV